MFTLEQMAATEVLSDSYPDCHVSDEWLDVVNDMICEISLIDVSLLYLLLKPSPNLSFADQSLCG